MRTGTWAGIGMFALGLLLAGGLAFGKGFIKNPELLDKILIGVTTSKQVTEMLGPPASVSQFDRRGVEAWDYSILEDFSKRKVVISIEIDGGGIVRNVVKIIEYGP
jgi:hypothetical protein